MGKAVIVIIILALIAFVAFGQYVGVRNTLVTKNEAVKAAWSQVDIVLQRRADLIPNLVATVKGYAQQEQTVFGDIAKARSALLSAGTPSDKIAANQQLDGALGRLLAIVENYPQLKSNENFLRLQDELAGTENRIAVERKRYNDTLAGLQHLHPEISQQHLCRLGRVQAKRGLLRGVREYRARCRRSISLRPRPPRRPRLRLNPRTSVEADFGVELGAEDETLELPGTRARDGAHAITTSGGSRNFFSRLKKPSGCPNWASFLRAVNSPAGILETAKCDAWFSIEINPEEEIFGAACKFGSYVDLVFSRGELALFVCRAREIVKRVTQLLKRVPEIPAAAELIIRRCFYHATGAVRDGFYVTLYLFGYGDDEPQARQRWAIALKLVENAIRQISAAT